MKARRAIRKAIRNQIENRGFSLVEILSACPTGWKMAPEHSWEWIEQQMIPVFPLGVYKDTTSSGSRTLAVSQMLPTSSIVAALDLGTSESPLAGADLPRLLEKRSVWSQGESNAPTTKALKIAGFGGQGVLSLGVILAIAAMKDGLHASWLPSYGPEMRGGTAHCDVILSRGEIGSPIVDQPDVLIAMNTPSLLRFQSRLKPDGLIIYDSSLVTESPETPHADCLSVPASQMASELGEPKTANLIILGALIEKVPFLTPAAIHLAIDEIVRSDKLRRLNREALELGRNYG